MRIREDPWRTYRKLALRNFCRKSSPSILIDAAHFMQAGAHALSDAVAKSFAARGGSRWRNRTIRAGGGLIVKIGRNDGGAVVVIAGIENQADRVPNPFSRLYRAQFVEDQDIAFQKPGEEHPVRWFERWRYTSSEFPSAVRDSRRTGKESLY